MKVFEPLLAAILLSSCASTRAPDRTEAEKNYLTVESKSQETSKERADHTSQALAIGSRVRALDSQIANQRAVMAHWKSMREVPSAPAMIANARERLRQLNAEKAELLGKQAEELERVKDLNEE